MTAKWLMLLFLFNSCFSNGETAGKSTTDVFYEDVKELITCFYRECATHNNEYFSNGCDCDVQCSAFDTCCADSAYRSVPVPQLKPACRSINNNNYGFFMVDQCPGGDDSDAALKHLCAEDYYKEDDPMRLVPVTSLLSNVTYKNYFCFRCHEAHKDYVFWDLSIQYHTDRRTEVGGESITLSYNNGNRTWMALLEESGALLNVNISIVPNYERDQKVCFLNVTSTCSETWQGDDIRDKCNAYTFIVVINKTNTSHIYRNPHCALCNFVDLKLADCERYTISEGEGEVPFSFTHLLDINGSGGNKVGRKELCDESFVWDPVFKKCRAVSCIEPGYIISNGKCVPP